MKIRPVGAELFRADRRTDRRKDGRTDGRTDRQTHRQTDRQTDMTKLIAAFGNFSNASRNCNDDRSFWGYFNITINHAYSSSIEDFYALQEYNHRLHHILIYYVLMPFWNNFYKQFLLQILHITLHYIFLWIIFSLHFLLITFLIYSNEVLC
jgi:hypothetical protein